jgi:hypothetical protein
MKMTGFLSNNYVPNDPHGTSYNEGATSIVRHIIKQLKLNLQSLEAQLTEEYSQDDN